jgi:hypothetical protein
MGALADSAPMRYIFPSIWKDFFSGHETKGSHDRE